MKSTVTLIGAFLSPFFLFSQLTFQQFPKPLQLFPRDLSNNSAQVVIQGTAPSSPDSLILTLEKSDGEIDRKAISLQDLPGDQFSTVFDIEAGLWSYTLKAELRSGNDYTLLMESGNIVAGDVFTVEGQSNAQAVSYNGDANIWQSNFVRSFGTPSPDILNDEQWYIAEGNGYFTPGAVGQWALRMAYLLQENLQVPVAIINGADPGKPIEFFQRNDAQPNDPATNYGRLLQRLINAGVKDQVRAMLYYQGESDGDRALIHKTLFDALHADWEEDLPNIEAYYIVQVREGCGSPSLQLREYQRAFEDYLPHAHAVTANGINGHDGCHYALQGYQTLGEKLYKQISAELYNTPTGQQTNVRALNASFTNDLNTQISIETDASSNLTAETGSAYDFKIHGASASVIGIQADGNRLILDLDQSVNSPGAGLSYGGHSGSNAWVLNGDGYGMFTFYNLPVDNYHVVPNFDLPGIMSGSGNCISLDGVDDYVYAGPILNSSYTKEAWINWQGGSTLNNIISGSSGTAFWAPNRQLSSGHNGEWFQVTDNVVLPSNQWIHVAVTYDATKQELKLYKNGKLISQAQNIPGQTDPEVFVGAFSGCCTFQGKVDEVRIWDTVRTIDEIRANMCQKIPAAVEGLASYFRFDQTAGNTAPNVTAAPAGQLTNFQGFGLNEAWRRSGAPIGTKSTNTYKPVDEIGLALASGDSLVFAAPDIPDFVHLYFVEEVPNVLEPAEGYALVDNGQYFGVFYPDQSIGPFDLSYSYPGNQFAAVQKQQLGLLQRRNNAQSYWDKTPQFQNNPVANRISTSGALYQEYILAISDSMVLSPMSVEAILLQSILCFGQSGAIQATVSGGLPPYSFSLNGGTTQSGALFTGLSEGVYNLVVTDQQGNTASANTIIVTSPAPLLLNIDVFENSATVTVTGGAPNSNYVVNTNAPNINLQDLPNGTYYFQVTDANGCEASTNFTIDYHPLSSTNSLLDLDICDGAADIVVEAQGGESPYQYSLDFGPFQSSNTFQDLPSGFYTVVVMDYNGHLATLDQIEVKVPEQFLASAEVAADTIVVHVTGGISPYTFTLYGGQTQSDSIFAELLPGFYTFLVTDATGCSAEVEGLILSSGISAVMDPSSLSVRPNPSKGIFEIQGKDLRSDTRISILDVNGKLLQSFDLQASASSESTKIDLSAQADGIYFLQIKAGNRLENIRLVKIR